MTITSLPGATESETDLAARFTREVMPLCDVLTRGARRWTRSEADAEDLVQDTLLNAYKGFRTFKPGTNLQAWLFRILHNQWVNNYHHQQRRPAEVFVDMVTGGDLESRAARIAGPRSAEDEALDAFADDRIKAALAALPEEFRAAVYYIDVEGYGYRQTAEMLDIPLGTVMSRLARGRKRLRIALAHLARGRDNYAAVEPRIA